MQNHTTRAGQGGSYVIALHSGVLGDTRRQGDGIVMIDALGWQVEWAPRLVLESVIMTVNTQGKR